MAKIPFGPSPSPCSTTPNPRRNYYHLSWPRVIQPVGLEPSATKQEFKDQCDINSILRRYQRTGALDHYAKFSPEYGEFNACDLQTAQNMLIRARSLFDALPSSIRDLTKTPEGFFNFVNDPKNSSRLVELGLVKGPDVVPAPPVSTSSQT